MARWLAPLAILLALAYVAWLSIGLAASQQPATGELGPRPAAAKQWLGSGSCVPPGAITATACKAISAANTRPGSCTTSMPALYEVLFNAKSRAIVSNLHREDGKAAPDLALCLNCHVHKDYKSANRHPQFAKEDGVSCESCHGPAGSWLSGHYKAGLTDEQKTAMGMWDTRSIAGRVRSCTPCHVGAEGMEVDHNLIAAGHPRLAFEFSASALMPHHWQDAKDKKPGETKRARPDWDAAAWFVGQAATAQASLELLAARTRSERWPEFAEYDCYACHRQLDDKAWQQEPRDARGTRPIMPWNDWYNGSLSFEIHPEKFDPKQLLQDFAKLRSTDGGQDCAAQGNRSARGRAYCPGIGAMGQALRRCPRWFRGRGRCIEENHDRAAKHKAASWDEAAQTYLAVAAMYHASKNAGGKPLMPQVRESLLEVRSRLQFPPDIDGPQPTYTPEVLRKLFGQLQEHLAK